MTASPETLLARGEQNKKADRWSGIVLATLMVAALALVGQRIYAIATGPLPPGPGVAAPAFTATGLDGEKRSLEAYRDKVVLLDFWATWCPPCVASLPHLEQLHRDFGDRGLVVLGVNQEPGMETQVVSFLRRRNITFPSVVDRGKIQRDYGVFSFPTTFVIDKQGVIRAAFRGPAPEPALRKSIEGLL